MILLYGYSHGNRNAGLACDFDYSALMKARFINQTLRGSIVNNYWPKFVKLFMRDEPSPKSPGLPQTFAATSCRKRQPLASNDKR
jgi:hypothetical protein